MTNDKTSGQTIPSYPILVEATFSAIKLLGDSGKNDEINEKASELLELSDSVLEIPHLGSTSMSEINYRLAWARTLLKNYGAIENSARCVWSITTEFADVEELDGTMVCQFKNKKRKHANGTEDKNVIVTFAEDESDNDMPEEVKPWRTKLHNVILSMDPYAFERLAQRVLRECGFTNVEVTKKSGDGGIDGTGKLKINGIFSFNIAFQCKRYQGTVGAPEIRDFRGSLTTDIEKGVFITTGTFSKAAREEASNPGKQQIDLVDGEDFIDMLAEYSIGVKEIKDYEIDERFFMKI